MNYHVLPDVNTHQCEHACLALLQTTTWLGHRLVGPPNKCHTPRRGIGDIQQPTRVQSHCLMATWGVTSHGLFPQYHGRLGNHSIADKVSMKMTKSREMYVYLHTCMRWFLWLRPKEPPEFFEAFQRAPPRRRPGTSLVDL